MVSLKTCCSLISAHYSMYYLLTLEVTGCHPPKTELQWRSRHLLLLLCARRGWNPYASSNQTVQTISQRITKVNRRFDSIVAAVKFIFKQMSAGGTSVVLKFESQLNWVKCLWRVVRWQGNLWQKVVRRFNFLISPLRVHALFIFILGTENIFPSATSLVLQWKTYQVPDLLSKVMQSLPIFLGQHTVTWTPCSRCTMEFLFVFVCILLVLFALET